MMLEHRTPRLFVSPGILPLTSLVGAEFVKAWLETVKRMSNTLFFFFSLVFIDLLEIG